MFQSLVAVNRILVTGPQRSGTTIAAKMIARDTGFTYIDEDAFSVYDESLWYGLAYFAHRVVVHCPHMLKRIVDRPPPALVVLMRRDIRDIHASEVRIGWGDDERRLELEPFGSSEGDPALLKYAYWESNPKPPVSLELQYESLSAHPMWVPREQRAGFSARQTER